MPDIIKKTSPNYDERAAGVEPTIIILHYTGMQSAGKALNRLCDPEAKVSAHYTIDEQGAIYQHVEEDKRAWHAGVSSWENMKDINSRSIGIEIVNPGHEFGYKPFTDQEIDKVIELCTDIKNRYEIEYVLAHSDVAPDRKQDPGELFPWEKLAKNNIGVWPAVSDEDCVKAAGIDVMTALRDFGYKAAKPHNMLVAFQRHYVPEVFEKGTEGTICSLTKGRLYALLARHYIGGLCAV